MRLDIRKIVTAKKGDLDGNRAPVKVVNTKVAPLERPSSTYVAERPDVATEVRTLLLAASKAENAALGAPRPAAPAQAA